MNVFTFARCSFDERIPQESGGYVYRRLRLSSPDAWIVTSMPPAVDDIVCLHDGGHAFVGRVVARQWMYSEYGSMDWPFAKPPQTGPMLKLIVEKADGVYIDEVIEDEEAAEQEA